jgi:hypothetical protein
MRNHDSTGELQVLMGASHNFKTQLEAKHKKLREHQLTKSSHQFTAQWKTKLQEAGKWETTGL